MSATVTDAKPHLPRWLRGVVSTIGVPLAWIGRLFGFSLNRFRQTARYERGLIIVLPGIESESFLNHSIAWGLSDGGWQGAIELYDWTTSLSLLLLFHLRSWRRNQRQASVIARRVMQYQAEYPGRPVHLIGHSGGGALAVMALEALPTSERVTSAILLAPALSPGYPLITALDHTERGIWSFWSPLDVIFCGAGTLLLGTIDGKWMLSAGMIGFRTLKKLDDVTHSVYEQKLHQIPYSWRMLGDFNLGGHFGCVNRVFVEKWVAPVLESSP